MKCFFRTKTREKGRQKIKVEVLVKIHNFAQIPVQWVDF